jgi:flagellar hook-basal body complex protein FliE
MLDAVSSISPANSASATSERLLSVSHGVSPAASADASADFGAFLAQLTGNMADALKAGEAAAIAGVRGAASTQQVVEAVMAAEQTLQTAVAIRDKVVAAFLEVSRMQI